MADLQRPGSIICVATFLILLFLSQALRDRRQEERQRRDILVDSTEIPAEHIDPAAIDLTPLVNTLINTSQSGSRQLFSLLSVTSYSSLALHKLTLLLYNISSIRSVESSRLRRRFCYCVTNETNDLTDFTAVLLDVMGNSSSYLQELFKSASILSVSQRNNSDCIYICVMAGKMGRDVPELWEVGAITPLFNQTIVEGPHRVGNVSSFRLPVAWNQLPTNLSHMSPSGMSSMLTSRVHSTAHISPTMDETAATTAKMTTTQQPAPARQPATVIPQSQTTAETAQRGTTLKVTTLAPTTAQTTTTVSELVASTEPVTSTPPVTTTQLIESTQPVTSTQQIKSTQPIESTEPVASQTTTTLQITTVTTAAASTTVRTLLTTPRAQSTTVRAPSVIVRAPSTTVRGPSTTGRGPSTTGRGPSTTGRVPSTTVRGPSTTARGPSTTLRGPSTTLRGPSTTLRGPSTTLRGPSTTVRGPSTTVRGPSTTVRGPSTTVRGPSTIIRARSTTIRVNMDGLLSTTVRGGLTTVGAPSVTMVGAPLTTGRAPSTTSTTQPTTASTTPTTFSPVISLTGIITATHQPSTTSQHTRSTVQPPTVPSVRPTAGPTVARRTTGNLSRTTTPSKTVGTEKPGCPWRRPELTAASPSGSTTTVGVHKLQPCVLELCRFFSQCLCRPFSQQTRMKRYCADSHLWYKQHTSEVCRRVRRISFSRSPREPPCVPPAPLPSPDNSRSEAEMPDKDVQ